MTAARVPTSVTIPSSVYSPQSVWPGLRGAMVQASSGRHITTGTQVRSQCSQCRTVDGHSGTGAVYPPIVPIHRPLSVSSHKCSVVIHSASTDTMYRGADKSLARPTSRYILFDG